jgi:hypothetical protein
LTRPAAAQLVFVAAHRVRRTFRKSLTHRPTRMLMLATALMSLVWSATACAEPFRLIITESVTPLVPKAVTLIGCAD